MIDLGLTDDNYTMDQSEKDTGTLTALMLDLEENRLPQAMHILEKVDKGELLSDRDIGFLKKVYEDSRANEFLVERHPEYVGLICVFLAYGGVYYFGWGVVVAAASPRIHSSSSSSD